MPADYGTINPGLVLLGGKESPLGTIARCHWAEESALGTCGRDLAEFFKCMGCSFPVKLT
jgi:hypothetical protein